VRPWVARLSTYLFCSAPLTTRAPTCALVFA
jgi:hypothetical protein